MKRTNSPVLEISDKVAYLLMQNLRQTMPEISSEISGSSKPPELIMNPNTEANVIWFCNQGAAIQDMADYYSTSRDTIWKCIYYLLIRGMHKGAPRPPKILADPDKKANIIELYNQGMPVIEIAANHKTSKLFHYSVRSYMILAPFSKMLKVPSMKHLFMSHFSSR